MEDLFESRYRAIRSRDPRFDGRFITAVTSTGIYCRPICPAQTPRPENVRFYPCSAAAEAAGFRACRRCRPEASPGSPEWDLRSDLAARALRLIADGAIDEEGVVGLAKRLAVSSRHLHRELTAAVGVGPLALARTRRAQTARLLIDQSALSITEIAFAAGFSSLRQFNASMHASFGAAPMALRRHSTPIETGTDALLLRLPYRPPFDATSLLAYLARRAVPGVEAVVGGRYLRTVALPHGRATLSLDLQAGSSHVALRARMTDLRDLATLTARCRQLLDLDADPVAIAEVLATDPLLAPLVAARPGLRLPGTVGCFEMAVRIIIGQQISVAGARTLLGRLVAAFGMPLPQPEGPLTHLFPSPEQLAKATLEGIGLTRARCATIRTLAAAVATGSIALDRGADRTAVAGHLLELPGVGPWTAASIAMRALGDPDAWPGTDLVLRRTLPMSPAEAEARSEAWRPWRAYAAQHIWTAAAVPTPTA